MNKAIVSLSGGMDSATVLDWLKAKKRCKVEAVSFDYGSKHNEYELPKAEALAAYYGVPHEIINLKDVFGSFKSDLLLSGGDIPEGHYTDASMVATVVPCRNLIMLSIIAGLAESKGCDTIALGIHQGDHAIYPDCRESFYNSLRLTVQEATDGKVDTIAPFLNTDKYGILEYGFMNDVPYKLTRTCYKAQELSCGKCGSCVERIEAFAKFGTKDPIAYENC